MTWHFVWFIGPGEAGIPILDTEAVLHWMATYAPGGSRVPREKWGGTSSLSDDGSIVRRANLVTRRRSTGSKNWILRCE